MPTVVIRRSLALVVVFLGCSKDGPPPQGPVPAPPESAASAPAPSEPLASKAALTEAQPSNEPPPPRAAAAPAEPRPIEVTGGFQTPESVLHDVSQDVYLVSNIHGSPLDKDDNGFISRVAPDGRIDELKWIDGAGSEVTLHAPKGMAILGDTLYVADIDVVRRFDARTGVPRGEIKIPKASFLNDLVAGTDTVYVSDSGFGSGFKPTGSDAIYAIQGEKVRPVARGTDLKRPNGLALRGDELWVVTFGGNELYRITRDGKRTDVTALPKGALDGLAILENGMFLVSSWDARAIYAGTPGGAFEERVSGVESPADIGWDARRRRVLIPIFQGNAVRIVPLAALAPNRP